MKNYPFDDDNYGRGTAPVCWFRWHNSARPGCYIVSAWLLDGVLSINAVIDDFGDFVRVP